jgi:hypothetical protein
MVSKDGFPSHLAVVMIANAVFHEKNAKCDRQG